MVMACFHMVGMSPEIQILLYIYLEDTSKILLGVL